MRQDQNLSRAPWIVIAALCAITGCGSAAKASAPASTTTTLHSAATTAATSTTTTTAPVTTTTIVPADAGTWSRIADASTSPGDPIAWTGTELLTAESGCCDDLGSVNLTAYNPATNTRRELPPTPLSRRFGAAGVWTGNAMIIAGGVTGADGSSAAQTIPTVDGASWDAATNTWHPIAAMPTSLPMGGDPTAVWTGQEMLVWSSVPAWASGSGGEVALAYNPATNTWRGLPASGLALRTGAVTIWTGKELVVWSGLSAELDSTIAYGDGARLDPATGTWRSLPAAPVPARGEATAVWSGHEVLVWGGETSARTEVGKGAAYNPETNTWRALPFSPLRAKTRSASVWTGRFFVVIGGSDVDYTLPVPGPGSAAYDPASNSWTALPAAPRYRRTPDGPTYGGDQREDAFAVWTGKAVVLVGGYDFNVIQGSLYDGVAWTPAS